MFPTELLVIYKFITCISHIASLFSRASLESSHSSPSPMSSAHSSQDSLHKHAGKKKGIKSSLGRLFSKKETKIKMKEQGGTMGEHKCSTIYKLLTYTVEVQVIDCLLPFVWWCLILFTITKTCPYRSYKLSSWLTFGKMNTLICLALVAKFMNF